MLLNILDRIMRSADATQDVSRAARTWIEVVMVTARPLLGFQATDSTADGVNNSMPTCTGRKTRSKTMFGSEPIAGYRIVRCICSRNKRNT